MTRLLRVCASLLIPCVLVAASAASTAAQAVIRPVESNLATKFWASVSVSTGATTATAAVDGDPSTVWLAEEGAAEGSLTLDLGGVYDNVRKVEVVFPDPGGYRYTVDASSDGAVWQTLADHSGSDFAARGAVHLFTRRSPSDGSDGCPAGGACATWIRVTRRRSFTPPSGLRSG